MPARDQQTELADFLARHIKTYDPATDDYERPPFAADIREGKNDPIYNAHSYHTKVPPRGIIPYILHYTRPGDLVLDPFCGSGMTGVAAQMCANPPSDLLAQYPELKDRIGPRACILNDLSPAACHIAYNYNTSVDVEALRREFERIKAAVKDEFDWLYGTEHYEPAGGSYNPANSEVASRLKNPPDGGARHTLLTGEERTWQLLSTEEVEKRLGYSVTDLPREKAWGDLDIVSVKQWICIPATIQYTIWSDVYRCEGFITIEEPTGKISTRGKNVGKSILLKKRLPRGCGADFTLWEAAVNEVSGEVAERFRCPRCQQEWRKIDLKRQRITPVNACYEYSSLKGERRVTRRITSLDASHVEEISTAAIPYCFPKVELNTSWPQYRRDALSAKKIYRVSQFYTHRNLWALSRVRHEIEKAAADIKPALLFALTGIAITASRMNTHHFGGQARPRVGTLYVPSFAEEANVLRLLQGKTVSHPRLFTILSEFARSSQRVVRCGSASDLNVTSNSIDYIFTDPPFGSNIYYSDLNIIWEAWLGSITDRTLEAVIHRKNDGGNKRIQQYEELMAASFERMHDALKPGRFATIVFNNSDGAVFEVIKRSIHQAGFIIQNMLFLDKVQRTFKQIIGDRGEQDVVGMDVVFNILKPALAQTVGASGTHDLELQVAAAARRHLETLPDRIDADPARYSAAHRTTATINSVLMNTLIPKGVSVERLNLPFIESVCARYFRKVGQYWYLRGESAGSDGNDGLLIPEETVIRDELTAIAWLRQKLQARPMLIGELKPYWQRATGLLTAEISQSMILEDLLTENFWRDLDTNRWREPTPEERERMNDDRSLRVLHDAERFVNGALRRGNTDEERCDWIDVLYQACRAIEDNEMDALPALRGFDKAEAYALIPRLFQSILRDGVPSDAYTRAEKQARAASQRVQKQVQEQQVTKATSRAKGDAGQGKLDFKKPT